MEQAKRQRNNTFNDDNDKKKKRKLLNEIKMINLNKSIFEDLSNEIFYEIFEYLDIYYVYQGFIDLNKRFENLIINSTLPIKINISTISKRKFDYYHINIIIPNKHRITLLRLSNPFTVDIILSPPRIITKFICLERLFLNNIKGQYLYKILNHLIILPKFHSLILTLAEYVQCPSALFLHIFRLPKLKYCQITYRIKDDQQLLPIIFDKYPFSSIEHLIINSRIRFDSFDILLYCLPQLHRLSIDWLVESDCTNIESYSIILKNLKYVSLKIDNINFDRFEKLIKNYFYYVEVLYISTFYDSTYLDAKRWEQLISSSIPNLRIFDINHDGSARINQLPYHDLINEFKSSFWIEKQWFFTHQHDYEGRFDGGIFYSTHPYRRKDYTFYWEMVNHLCPHVQKMNLNSVKHVCICIKQPTNHCIHYFPNATQLTIQHYFDIPIHSIPTMLNRIIPLKQINKLIMDCYDFSFEQFINLLRFLPKLHTLNCNFININETHLQSDTLQYVSVINQIKNLNIKSWCSLELIQMIMNLFPQLEYLKTGIYRKELIQITRYILSKINNKAHQLFFLCFTEIPKICLTEIDVLIELENLLDHYFIKYVNRDLYLWW